MKILLHVRCRQDVATGVCFKYMAYFCSYAICDHLAKAGHLTNYPWPSYVDDRGRCCGVAQTYHFKCTNKFIEYHRRRKIIRYSFPSTLPMITKKVREKNPRFTDILVFSFALQISLPVMRNRKCVSQCSSKVRVEMGQPGIMPQR